MRFFTLLMASSHIAEAFAPLQFAVESKVASHAFKCPCHKRSNLFASISTTESTSSFASEPDPRDHRLEIDIPESLMTLPRHSHGGVNKILRKTESALRGLHRHSKRLDDEYGLPSSEARQLSEERVYANAYVDLAKIDIIGFDYDYTLVSYTDELLELIYDMALNRLVTDLQYPLEMLNAGLKFDPSFSIRGLAVDKETAWICHLSYTHKVAVAWEGREKVPTTRVFSEYRGKRVMNPAERKSRIKPLNDLFSMAECCLIADTVQFFKDSGIAFCPRNCVADILSTIGSTHMSGDFHRIVAENPPKYFQPTPFLKEVLKNLKRAGKRLIFVSNSPFWYVDKGMRYVIGDNWRDSWDAVICSAGKPNFYTDTARPFREVCQDTGRIKFNQVVKFEKGAVYKEGCIKELTRLMDWTPSAEIPTQKRLFASGGGDILVSSNVLYIGDSLFADLVDAKREFGWTTAAVTPEVAYETGLQSQSEFIVVQRTLDLLLTSLRLMQEELGAVARSEEDTNTLDALEKLVSKWRDRESQVLGNPFGSVFRARYQPSLFAHSLRRYCDLYMSSVSSLRNYSPQHRFYPEDSRLLSHEMRDTLECWNLEDVLASNEL